MLCGYCSELVVFVSDVQLGQQEIFKKIVSIVAYYTVA